MPKLTSRRHRRPRPSQFDDRNCTVGGKASAYNGNYVGGIAGHLTSGKISGCTIAASASLSSKGDHTGGIVGALQANEENADDGSNMTAVVEDCETDIMVFRSR